MYCTTPLLLELFSSYAVCVIWNGVQGIVCIPAVLFILYEIRYIVFKLHRSISNFLFSVQRIIGNQISSSNEFCSFIHKVHLLREDMSHVMNNLQRIDRVWEGGKGRKSIFPFVCIALVHNDSRTNPSYASIGSLSIFTHEQKPFMPISQSYLKSFKIDAYRNY